MRLEPPYRVTFTTPESWRVEIRGRHRDGGTERGEPLGEVA
jgi:hypothetical protein